MVCIGFLTISELVEMCWLRLGPIIRINPHEVRSEWSQPRITDSLRPT
jgi:hypothetical protein